MSYFKVLALCSLFGFASLATPQNAPQSTPVVVRSGAITLKVADFNAARDEVSRIAAANGGHVVGGQVRVTDKGKSHGWLRVVVPQAQLDASMHQLRGIGSIYGDTLKEQALSEEVKDLASRTGRLQQHQDRLADMLQNSKRLRGSDILFVQDRLFRAGVDQDLLGHRREQMIGSSNVSNISVNLFEPGAIKPAPAIPKTFGEKTAYAFGEAWKSFGKFVAQTGLMVATVIVYGFVWVPILVVLFLLARKLRPRFRLIRPAQPSA